jgi:hypothetical protein
MAGNAFTNLNTISLSDNFRAWFDKTNEIVGAVNPVSVYGVTPGIGITVAINANGIATVGLSLEDATTGDTNFTGSLTFSNEVRFTGLTMDVSGATLFGNVVRSINGLTGAVTIGLTGINDPTTATGDILIKSGGTFGAYSAFNGQTFLQNMPFRFAASGGMLLGGNTGGSAGVHDFKNGPLGTLQIATDGGTLGSTLAFVHLLNSGYTGSDIAEHGTQLFFGRIGGAGTDGAGLVVRGGGTNAFDPAGPMLVIDQTNRRIGINGITSAEGPLHIKGESTSATSANEITIQSTTGKTAAIRAAVAGTTGEYTGLEGSSSITTPRFRGFNDLDRLRTIIGATSMPVSGVELRHTSNIASFSILGQHSNGASLSPVLTARQDGSVVIGGISSDDGSGTTFGTLNIASGSILLGGTAGATIAETGGVLSLLSKGGTLSHKNLFADSPNGGGSTSVITNVTFSGNITDDMVTDVRELQDTTSSKLRSVDETGTDLITPSTPVLDFFEFDSSGNRRHAVGNFEIEVTMPLYTFVNDFTATSGSSEFKSVIGAIAFIDQDKTLTVPGFDLGQTSIKRPIIMSPSLDAELLKMDDLSSDVPRQISFTLRGNCTTGVRVALITSKTHASIGKRNGAIYRAPGSFSAKFFNVE